MVRGREVDVRRFGMVGSVGGVLLLLYAIPDLVSPGTFSGTGSVAVAYGLVLLGILLMLLVGVVGLHERLRDHTGRLERVGYYAALVGFAVAIVSDVHLYAVAGGDAPTFITFILGYLVVLVGSALVGIAGWRADALPRSGAVLLAVAPLGIPGVFLLAGTSIGTPFVAVTVPYGAAWVVVGRHLWTVG